MRLKFIYGLSKYLVNICYIAQTQVGSKIIIVSYSWMFFLAVDQRK